MRKIIFLFLITTGRFYPQSYTYQLPNALMSGIPGDVFNADMTFSNTSLSPISLKLDRFDRGLPQYWYSCYCYIQCHSYLTDTLNFQVQPYSTQTVTVQFRTDSINPGIATSKFKVYQYGYENSADTFQLVAITNAITHVKQVVSPENISLFPNPVKENLYLNIDQAHVEKIRIVDHNGKVTQYSKSDIIDNKINLSGLQSGIYLIEIDTGKNKSGKKIIKE